MKTKLEFINGDCYVTITPEDEWEQKILAAVAKGKEQLAAEVTYKSEGHDYYGQAKLVAVKLSAYINPDDPY